MRLSDNFELVTIRKTLTNRAMTGVYVVDLRVTDAGLGDFNFQDSGNGPEVTNDGVDGPFASRTKAMAWVAEESADPDNDC